MRLKSILNRVEPHAGFVYEKASFASSTDPPTIEIAIRPRRRSRATCSGCGQRRAGYDRLAPRRFEFVPLWGLAVVFVYAMRRVDCPQCGVKVDPPWGDSKKAKTNWRRAIDMWQPYLKVIGETNANAHCLFRYSPSQAARPCDKERPDAPS